MEGTVSLDGKSIVVTGAGSGIGAAAGRMAAAAGARVMLADRDQAAGEAVLAGIVDAGGEARFARCDIGDEAAVRALVDAAVEVFGRIDGAFNNAARPSFSHTDVAKALADMPNEAMERAIAVNVMGTFYCLKHEIAAMLGTGGGAIVNTASNAGVLAIPNAADYVTTKHAVIGLTKSAALDYARAGIRVNAVLPGVTRTKMMEESFARNPELNEWAAEVQPNGRVGEPEEIAAAALWLLSDAASFVTGIAMHVDGGYAMT
ncbi:glucose 1-dehydrogenase [Sphingomonas sp.]|uniref:glucose 1-dehydrogenase n=1 Tax=Sphingomonas sp. TaxID=28214 RepID=UPI003B00C49B